MGLIIGVVVVVGLFVWMTLLYNSLVTLRNRFKNAFSQIDVQLQRRYDLIPNLVEVARGYLKHERETLEAVMAARATAFTARERAAGNPADAAAIRGLGSAEGVLTQTLGRLMAVAESYPDLKANQNMMQLTEEMSSTENKVAFARQAYNDAVTFYNTARETFPAVIFSGGMGFHEAALLSIENTAARQAPKVSF
jgi:LemA protein